MRKFALAVMLLASMSLAACTTPERLDAVPDEQFTQAEIPGIPDVRFFIDRETDPFLEDVIAAGARERAWRESQGLEPRAAGHDYLALSGGADYGAFGAGFLNGWTASGTRPEFKLVTGVSTGSLIAPFAFLGPDYDDQLKEVYTTISKDDIFAPRSIFTIASSDGAASTEPLGNLIARYFDEEMMQAVAREYEKGRLLLVATTNMDSLRAVVWDITKIAASGHPDALPLIHDVLRASASIPGAFSPVIFDVEVDGVAHQEMHVDGGMTAQVFIYPPSLNVAALQREGRAGEYERRLWIIRNWRVDPEWDNVERSVFPIAERSMNALMQLQGNGDLYVIFTQTRRDGIDYNLAFIPDEFSGVRPEPFDTEYMNRLYDFAFDLAKDGDYEWSNVPPGFVIEEGQGPAEPEAKPLTN